MKKYTKNVIKYVRIQRIYSVILIIISNICDYVHTGVTRFIYHKGFLNVCLSVVFNIFVQHVKNLSYVLYIYIIIIVLCFTCIAAVSKLLLIIQKNIILQQNMHILFTEFGKK